MSVIEDIGIGGRLRAARTRARLSREALAFHSGISWAAITQIESGRRTNLRPRTLASLAGTLGVTIDYLVLGGATSPPMLEHDALVYQSEADLLTCAEPFLAEGRERSEAMLVVASAANIKALRKRLGAGGDCVQFEERSSWYRTPGAALAAYRAFVDEHIGAGAPWVRIIGEPTWPGSTGSALRAWTRYESLLNLIFSVSPVTVLCIYNAGMLAAEEIEHVYATHPHTVEPTGQVPSPGYVEPGGYVLEV